MVQACGGAEAVPAALRLPLLVNAQQVSGVVPQEVGSNTNGTLYRGRQLFDRLGYQCLSLFGRLLNIDNLRHLSVFIQTQGEADLCGAPSGSGNLAALEKILIISRQRLQDRPLTSSLSHGGTTITPSVRLAQKNRGVMFWGSV